MKDRRIVVLFGESLLMDSVEASLGGNHQVALVRIRTAIADICDRLVSLRPDMVIFDLDSLHTRFVVPFLRKYPGTPLLGLDVNCSKVVVLSSQQYTVLTVDDLSEMIQMQTAACVAVDEHNRVQHALTIPLWEEKA